MTMRPIPRLSRRAGRTVLKKKGGLRLKSVRMSKRGKGRGKRMRVTKTGESYLRDQLTRHSSR